MAAGDEVFSSDLSFLEEIGIKLEKRRSCSLVETASPCVRKALFHLKNLQVCFCALLFIKFIVAREKMSYMIYF